MIGVILAALFIWNRCNLWLPMFAHGFVNTVGLTVLYLGLDWRLKHLIW